MYADTHDRPNLDEQYIMATNASDLTLDADRTTAVDHLIAAGLVGNRMGSILVHLTGEWASADKPPKWSDDEVSLRARSLPYRKGKPDLKRARAEAMSAHNRAMREVYLSLPSRRDAIAILAEWANRRGVDLDVLSPSLYHHLQPACSVCEGRKQLRMPDAPVLGKQCYACDGTGLVKTTERVKNWLKGCATKARSQRGNMIHGRSDVTPMADRLRGPEQADDSPEEQARVAEHFRRSLGLGRIK